MKLFSFIVMGSVFITLNVSASDICQSDPTLTQCVTAGTSTVGAGASGIYAAKKFSQAKAIERASTVVLHDTPSAPTALESSHITRYSQDVGVGDRITIIHHLNEVENRQLHLSNIQGRIRSAKSSESYHRSAAMNALIPKTEVEHYTDSNGKPQTRVVTKGPDLMAHMFHTGQADDYANRVTKLQNRWHDVKRGAPVPFIDVEDVVVLDGKTKFGRGAAWRQFAEDLKGKVSKGGKILHIAKLPAEAVKRIAKISGKGWLGVAGAAVLTGVAVEEVVAGHGAEAIDEYVPEMSEREDGGVDSNF